MHYCPKKGKAVVQKETEFDAAKEKGWYTAFYRYAEYLRLLTNGAVNHKSLYSLVGLNGRYVSSDNPQIRKRCASNLSRLLHSTRYAADFRESYANAPDVFVLGASQLAASLLDVTGMDEAALVSDLIEQGFPQLRAGLLSEISDGRIEVTAARLDGEMELLRNWVDQQVSSDASGCLLAVLTSFFFIMAFGHLEEGFANMLVDASPTAVLTSEDDSAAAPSLRACVMRAVESNPASIENMWAIGEEGSFCIGRYVDCDAIETNGLVSRRHCRIFRQGDAWYVRDEGSRFGTAVHRGGVSVWESGVAGAPECFPLAFGDCLVLAGQVYYWFVSLQNVERLLIG